MRYEWIFKKNIANKKMYSSVCFLFVWVFFAPKVTCLSPKIVHMPWNVFAYLYKCKKFLNTKCQITITALLRQKCWEVQDGNHYPTYMSADRTSTPWWDPNKVKKTKIETNEPSLCKFGIYKDDKNTTYPFVQERNKNSTFYN